MRRLPDRVYAIQRSDQIKIGISCDPSRRLSELSLRKFAPRVLVQVRTENPRSDERLLHYFFRYQVVPSWLYSEWFNVDSDRIMWAFENINLLRICVDIPSDFSLRRFRREFIFG